MSDCLWPRGLYQTMLPYPSLFPRVCSNSFPLSWWCHPTVSSPVCFLLLPSIFPSIRVFSKSWLFAPGGQSTGASASILAMNNQGWFPLELTGLISLLSKGLSGVFSSNRVWKHQFFSAQPSLWSNSHIHMWPLESHSFDYMDLCWQSDVSVFLIQSRYIRAFLSRSKCPFVSCLQSRSAVILEPKKIQHLSLFPLFPHLFAMKRWDPILWS